MTAFSAAIPQLRGLELADFVVHLRGWGGYELLAQLRSEAKEALPHLLIYEPGMKLPARQRDNTGEFDTHTHTHTHSTQPTNHTCTHTQTRNTHTQANVGCVTGTPARPLQIRHCSGDVKSKACVTCACAHHTCVYILLLFFAVFDLNDIRLALAQDIDQDV